MAFRNIYSPAPSSFVPSIPGEDPSFYLGASFSTHARHERDQSQIAGSTRSLDRRLLALNLDPDPAYHTRVSERLSRSA